ERVPDPFGRKATCRLAAGPVGGARRLAFDRYPAAVGSAGQNPGRVRRLRARRFRGINSTG
ncbi:MAG TPA: hypothetical protein VIQ02_11005, partial [Jiangellaceae bacterium]